MAWKLNDLFDINTTTVAGFVQPFIAAPNTAVTCGVVHDGDNKIWYTAKTSLSCITYFSDIEYEQEADSITLTSQLQEKFKFVAKINLPFQPRTVTKRGNYVFAADYPITTIARINRSTFAVDTISGIEGAESEIMATNSGGIERVYFVSKCPTTQGTVDSQYIQWVDFGTGAISTGPVIPGLKQTTCRNLAYANGRVYVTGFNSNQVSSFNAQTGNLVAIIPVNKGVTKIVDVGSNVYTTSAASLVEVGTKTMACSLVSKITSDNVVTHPHGIIGLPESFFDDGTNIWACNAGGYLQRITKSTNKTFYTKGAEPALTPVPPEKEDKNDDFLFDNLHTVGIKGMLLTTTVAKGANTFPAHLFILKAGKILCVRLPSALRWEYSLTLNQNTAVSTGADSYKGEI